MFSTGLEQKKVELARELVPSANEVGLLLDPTSGGATTVRTNVLAAGQALGIRIHVLEASSTAALVTSLDVTRSLNAAALIVGTSPMYSTHRAEIISLAAQYRLPAIYDSRIQVIEGGLASYGASYPDTYRQAGAYVGRILKGEKVSALPVLMPMKIELAINMRTAKSLGIAIPSSLLARADEVIE